MGKEKFQELYLERVEEVMKTNYLKGIIGKLHLES
jgi:hypothetical protein